MSENRPDRIIKIGGSLAAAICGVDPWCTPYEAWLKLRGELDEKENEAMYWGKALEPVVRKKYCEVTKRSVKYNENPDLYGLMVRHPTVPYIVGALDGISYRGDFKDKRVLEVKTSNPFVDWSDGVPEHYQVQCQLYLACTGYKIADVAVLIGGQNFQIFEVHRDEALIENMLEVIDGFWQDAMVNGNPPEMVTAADRLLKWPESNGEAVEGGEVADRLIRDLKGIRAGIAAMCEEKDRIETKIKDLIQDRDALTVGGKVVVTWKTSKPSTMFDAEQLKKDDYDLWKKYCSKARALPRRFLVK